MIHIEGLSKQFGQRVVVNNLSLSIKKGEFFALLGPNGAGKTTTIRILTMLTKPTKGRVLINGWDICQNELEVKASIGVVPQHLNLDIDLSAYENLELHGRLHHMEKSDRKKRISELLDYVELNDRAKEKVNTFSGGMKRRLMIARALMHRPSVLFLDEPTVGLDPKVRRKLWDLMRRLNSEGLTVLLTTHYIEEAEQLCSKVAIMELGSLIALESPSVLCQRIGSYALEWTESDGLKYKFFKDRQEATDFASNISANFVLRKTNLEDVFVELTGYKVMNNNL